MINTGKAARRGKVLPIEPLPSLEFYPTLRGRTFVLGVGAQKSGTSWLSQYLRSHPDVALSETKELHFFDARNYPDQFGSFDKKAIKALARIAGRPQEKYARLASKDLQKIDRARMIADDRAYLDLFTRLPSEPKVIGEITPSYTVLSEQELREIRAFLESAGLTVKPVLLLRDPVERAFSAARMRQRNAEGTGGKDAAEIALQTTETELGQARGRYDAIIQSLDSAFGPEGVHYEFYEHLFRQETVDRICTFLGIASHPGDFGDVRNPSPRPTELSSEQFSELRELLSPVYDFCRERFGDRIPDSWNT